MGYLPGYVGVYPLLRHGGVRHRLLLPAVHRTDRLLPLPGHLRRPHDLQPVDRVWIRIRLRIAFLLLRHAFGPACSPGWWGLGSAPDPTRPRIRAAGTDRLRATAPRPGIRRSPPPPGGYRPPPSGYPPGAGGRPPAARPPGGGGRSSSIYARPENRARNADRAQPDLEPARSLPRTAPTTSTRTGRAACIARTRAAPGIATRPRAGSSSRRFVLRPARALPSQQRRAQPPRRPAPARPPAWGAMRPPGSGAPRRPPNLAAPRHAAVAATVGAEAEVANRKCPATPEGRAGRPRRNRRSRDGRAPPTPWHPRRRGAVRSRAGASRRRRPAPPPGPGSGGRCGPEATPPRPRSRAPRGISRDRASGSPSPGSTFPPGNSHCPPRSACPCRRVTRMRPSRRMTAATTLTLLTAGRRR